MAIRVKTPINKDTGSIEESKAAGVEEPKVDDTKPKEDVEESEKKEGDEASTQSPGGEEEIAGETSDDEVVEVDGTEYKINADGDAVGEGGKIFMKKEELDELEKGSSEEEKPKEEKPKQDDTDVTIEDLEKLSGIIITDESGKKVVHDFTLEGLAEREARIKELGLKEGVSQTLQEFFNNNPDLYKAYIHKQNKGTLEGFTNEPVYSQIELDETNEQQLFDLIVEAEVKKGSSVERARSIAKFFKAEDKLAEEGKTAHAYLADIEKRTIDKFKKDQDRVKQEKKQEEAQFFGTYFNENGKEVVVGGENTIYGKVVEKGKVGNFVIPQSGIKVKVGEETKVLTRRDIFDYMSKPVNNQGQTQAQIDLAKRFKDMDVLLESYLLNLTNNDVGTLVERKVLEEKSKNIKRRLSTGSKTGTGASDSPSRDKDKRIKIPIRR